MNKISLFFLRLELHRLERAIDRPFDPDISRQIDCLQYLIDSIKRRRRK